jgi:protein TonB
MPDAARIAQAQALEVPVIIQGAKTAAGTDNRELFTENATTTLVFDDGAVLNLRTKLTVGQVVFLHNEQNKREVLCKVLEAPPEGAPGHTELEFTAATPGFWEAVAEQPEASAQPPEFTAEPVAAQEPAHEPAPEAVENTLEMMSATASDVVIPAAPMREELVAAHEVVPAPAAAASVIEDPEEWRAPTGEEIDAALRTMSGTPTSPETAEAPAHPQDAADPNDPKVQRHLAALLAREDRLAKYAAAKESQAEKVQRQAASHGTSEGEATADGASVPEVVPVRVPLSERLTTGRNAIIVEIAACILIAASLVFIWRAMRPMFVHDNFPRQAAAAPAKAPATPARPSPTPASASAGAPPAQAASGASSKAPQPVAAQKPAAPQVEKVAKVSDANVARVTKVAAPPLAAVGSGRGSAVAVTSPAPAETQMPPSQDTLASGEATAQPKHRKTSESNSLDIVPARILSKPQPAFPSWAKSLGVEGVVKLDAVIDEKGNVAETKVLSGPRELQRAAKQAVGLWIFEPAQSAGKPTSSHMVLTVEFQR